MIYMVCEPIGSIAKLENGRVYYKPLMADGTFSVDEVGWTECEPFQTDEPLNRDGFGTLGQYNQHVKNILS